ncbi:helix-turn-helix transcriptional regulator [uncultured Megamonas sp.]|uniref:helix-turn-helix domain-containing protein n=1 Tax=uncultured Megamonas sp. TaxID=286140 RepID=UPI00259332FC|nr:helix-turn-helix transcriptional regulator [uncultured Megamonas sp.]
MKKQLKELRQYLKKTQTDFGLLCGKSRDTISNYELGRVAPDESFIKLICMKFNVNENWLRTGQGDMFIETMDSMIENLAKKYNLNENDIDIIKNYIQLSEEDRKKFVDIIKIIYTNKGTVTPKRTKPDHKLTPEEKRRIVNGEIDQEEKATTSSASTGTNGM